MNTVNAHTAASRPVALSCLGARILKASFAALVIGGACVGPVQAGNLRNDGSLIVDCKAIPLPSQQEVERLLGTHNFSQTYAERARMMQSVRRECMRGVQQVIVLAVDPLQRSAPADVASTR